MAVRHNDFTALARDMQDFFNAVDWRIDASVHAAAVELEAFHGAGAAIEAIVRACEDGPDYLIETSTLTGAQTVALGARTPGVMGSDEFRDRVAEISQTVGENGWAMPLPEELKDDLKSTVADLANVSGSRFAGMLVAGTYLREFVADGVQWAHIDVAAPAYNSGGPWGYTPKGGTGVPTRTMFAVLEDIAVNG